MKINILIFVVQILLVVFIIKLRKKIKSTNDKKYKDKLPALIIILVISIGISCWYNYPKLLSQDEIAKKVAVINKNEGIEAAHAYLDRAYWGNNAKLQKVLFDIAREEVNEKINNNRVVILNTKSFQDPYSEYTTIKTTVKNQGQDDVSYIRYDIYFYDSDKNGNIIGSTWSNSDDRLPPGAMNTLEASVKVPRGTKSYEIKIAEVQ